MQLSFIVLMLINSSYCLLGCCKQNNKKYFYVRFLNKCNTHKVQQRWRGRSSAEVVAEDKPNPQVKEPPNMLHYK